MRYKIQMWEEQGAHFIVEAKSEKSAREIITRFVEGYGIAGDFLTRIEEDRIKHVDFTHRNVEVLWSDKIVCEHVCSGNCRRSGCNCDCGEFHNPKNE